jgi:hypothetical protein
MDSSTTNLDVSEEEFRNMFSVDVSDEALEAAAGSEAALYPTSTAYLYYCQC